MKITNIKYVRQIPEGFLNIGIKATIDGVEMFVPLDPANSHYAAIMEMVNAGELTIAEADE